MNNDGLEILDTDDDMHFFRHVKVFKLLLVQCDDGLKWLLQDLFAIQSTPSCVFSDAHSPRPSDIFSVKLVKTTLPS